jgi:hypothetical protein
LPYQNQPNNQKQSKMETYKNQFNEIVTKWTSHKHPNNPNFMQCVFWKVFEKPNGETLVGYQLETTGKMRFIYNLTKQEAIQKYSD